MKNQQLAQIFADIADIMELRGKGGDRFRILSYRKAAQTIRELPNDIVEIYKAGKLREIPGVGESLAKKIEVYLDTGIIPQYEKLQSEYPPSLFHLLSIPHLGPKKLKVLFEELAVVDIKSLEDVLKKGLVAELDGFGQKTAENIKKGIELRKTTMNRRLLGDIYPTVQQLIDYMQTCKEVEQIEAAGSFRRRQETVGDIDLLVIGKDHKKIIDHFVNHPEAVHVTAHGDTKGSFIMEGDQQVDLRVVDKESWGSALQYFTGSKEHNVKLRGFAKEQGIKLNEYGAYKGEEKVAGETEASMYECLGMQYIPPEMRSDRGEIDVALKKEIPNLIIDGDIKGDCHMHSTWSDGHNTIEEMALAGQKMGYEYVAITDHSQSLFVAHGLKPDQLKEKQKEIEAVQKKVDIKIFSGSEVDILADGTLDYTDEELASLDMVVASIHSKFGGDNTERIIKAMENKYVHCIGHLSGRLIGTREGYQLDYDAIFKKAAETGTWIEINSQPLRLDLQEKYIHKAQQMGVKFMINTDSHMAETLWLKTLGVSMARRGWLTKDDVINTLGLKDFEKALREKRGA